MRMKMNDDDVWFISAESGSIIVAAKYGTVGLEWPQFFDHEGCTYKYASNEVISRHENFGGKARYTLLSTTPTFEMRLCEQDHVVLRPNQLYIFTVDPNCPHCVKIAKSYE